VAAATLTGQRKATACKGIVDAICQRTPADHREFRRRGERGADKWTERKNDRSFRREGIDRRTRFVEQKAGSEAATADVPTQHGLGDGQPVGPARRDVDAKVTAVVAEHRSQPPASADSRIT